MALNVVSVTGTFFTSSASGVTGPAAGSLSFATSDILWNTSGVYVGIVASTGATFNQSGTITPVQLLAMDNAGFSGNWFWTVTIESGGTTYPTRKLVVDFANGATQDISALLATSTLI
jgi:hypothetical protein